MITLAAGPVVADPEAMTAELVARTCGTRAPGALELLEALGISLTAGPAAEIPEPVPALRPNVYRKPTRARAR